MEKRNIVYYGLKDLKPYEKNNKKFMKKFMKENYLPILSHIAKQWNTVRAWDLSTCISYQTNDYDHLDDWIYLNIDLWIKSTKLTLEELPSVEAFEEVNDIEWKWYEFLLSVAKNELFQFYNLMRLLKKIVPKKTFAVVLQWIHFWKERIAWSDWFMLFFTDNFYEKSDKEFIFDINSIHAILAHEYHNSWIKFFRKKNQIVIVSNNWEMITIWQSIDWRYPEYMNDKIVPSEFIWEYEANFNEVLWIAKYMKLDYIQVKNQILEVWYWYTAKLQNNIWDIHMTVKTAKIINWMTIKRSDENHLADLVEFPNNRIDWWTLVIKKIKW